TRSSTAGTASLPRTANSRMRGLPAGYMGETAPYPGPSPASEGGERDRVTLTLRRMPVEQTPLPCGCRGEAGGGGFFASIRPVDQDTSLDGLAREEIGTDVIVVVQGDAANRRLRLLLDLLFGRGIAVPEDIGEARIRRNALFQFVVGRDDSAVLQLELQRPVEERLMDLVQERLGPLRQPFQGDRVFHARIAPREDRLPCRHVARADLDADGDALQFPLIEL